MHEVDASYKVVKILLEQAEDQLRGHAYYNSDVNALEDILDQIRITLQFCRIPNEK
jgi:hypothetical protein